MMKYKYLLWDLDGTLTDPAIGITNSIIYSLGKFGIEVKDRTKLYKFIGPPLIESYKKFYGFDEEKAVLAVKYYREYFSVTGLFENKVYDGIPELLSETHENGFCNIVASSKPENYVVQILDHFNLSQYFDYICGSHMDASYESKADVIRDAMKRAGISAEDIAADKALMIGDRMHDIEGAHETGLKVAAVLWGYGDTDEFKQYNADYVAESLLELKNIVVQNKRQIIDSMD